MDILKIQHPHQMTEYPSSSTAIGNFDGLHAGHQQVIKKAIEVAQARGLKAGVMTFHPHPKEVLGSVKMSSYLTPLEDKLELLQELGIDVVFVVTFTPAFATLSPEEFIAEYIIRLNIRHVVTGFDFRFGHRGQGTVDDLYHWASEKQDFTYDMVSSVDAEQIKISSSRVRALLQEGQVDQLQPLLHRYYRVKGRVIEGEKRGRAIGFPTANLDLLYPYVLPRQGVYAIYVTTTEGRRLPAVCNIGTKPTFHTRHTLSVEVHILTDVGDLYGQVLKIEFVHFLRAERKFESVQQLIEQIGQDVEEAKRKLYI